MPKFNHIQNSFLAGELSPKARGRTDLQQYNHGAEELLNMLVMPQGGATRRPGTQFVSDVTSGGAVKLIPFVFSETEAYLVMISVTTISIINISSTSYTAASLNIATGSSQIYGSSRFAVQYAQSGDTMVLVHPSIRPQLLIRTSANTFTLEHFNIAKFTPWDPTLVLRQPFRLPNVSAITLTPTGASAVADGATTITLTASASFFNSGHVGAMFKLTKAAETGTILITGYTSATVVTGKLQNTLNAAQLTFAHSDWEECAWSTYRGWPRSVTFHESRLVYGGNAAQPDTIWASRIGSFFPATLLQKKLAQDASTDVSTLKYYGPKANDDAFDTTPSSQRINQIQWLASKNTLSAGTLGGEFIIGGSDPSQGWGPLNPGMKEQTSHGSLYVKPALASSAVLFPQKDGRKIREFLYNVNSDSFEAEDLSLLGDHYPGVGTDGTKLTISELAWSDSDSVLWCISTGGNLYAMTRNPKLGISAWHGHILGGTLTDAFTSQASFPRVVSICSAPSIGGTHDDVWMCVVRTVGASTVAYLEFIGSDSMDYSVVDFGSSSDRPRFSDSSVFAIAGAPSTAVTGLTHLNGETVAVFADGFVHPNCTVSAGAITLNYAATITCVGLPYTPRIRTLKPEVGAAIGSAQGAVMRFDRATIKFYQTVSAKTGPDADTLEEIIFRESDLPMDDPITPFTGDKTIDFTMSPDRDAKVVVTCDQPVPFAVLSITMRGDTRDS